MDTKKRKKTPFKYDCEKCDFHTSNKNDFTRHCKTIKHNDTIWYKNDTIKSLKQFICICGKIYKYSYIEVSRFIVRVLKIIIM